MSHAQALAKEMLTCPLPLRDCAKCGRRLEALVEWAAEAERYRGALERIAEPGPEWMEIDTVEEIDLVRKNARAALEASDG